MTRTVRVGGLTIGGGNRITVQSMTNTPTADYTATLRQIEALSASGCDIVRLAVSDETEVETAKRLLQTTRVPLVADIQFDYRLAIACSEIGFPKIRFNPGNIGSRENVERLTAACKANKTAIRIGVNSGSLEKELLNKYGPTAQALAESALNQARILEQLGFDQIVLSAKSSSVRTTIETYRILHERCDYPLHVGVTESGAYEDGLVKSSIGIGALLADGIGDTVRVSLSGDPLQEPAAAHTILRALKLEDGVEIVSCPTCSRCHYDLMGTVDAVRRMTAGITKPLTVAVMGCVVNGPGEAREADVGVAGGKDKAVIFKKGVPVKTVKPEEIEPELKKMLEELTGETIG